MKYFVYLLIFNFCYFSNSNANPRFIEDVEKCGILIDIFRTIQLCHFSTYYRHCPELSDLDTENKKWQTSQMLLLFSSTNDNSYLKDTVIDQFVEEIFKRYFSIKLSKSIVLSIDQQNKKNEIKN